MFLCVIPKIVALKYTPARKDYTHKCLFWELISRKKYISVTREMFLFSGVDSLKITLHVLVCGSENYMEILFLELFLG